MHTHSPTLVHSLIPSSPLTESTSESTMEIRTSSRVAPSQAVAHSPVSCFAQSATHTLLFRSRRVQHVVLARSHVAASRHFPSNSPVARAPLPVAPLTVGTQHPARCAHPPVNHLVNSPGRCFGRVVRAGLPVEWSRQPAARPHCVLSIARQQHPAHIPQHLSHSPAMSAARIAAREPSIPQHLALVVWFPNAHLPVS